MADRLTLALLLLITGCARTLIPDSITVTGVGADPRGIPQPHVAVSVTWFIHPTLVQMMPTVTTTTLTEVGR